MAENVSPTDHDQNLDKQNPQPSGSRSYLDNTENHDDDEDSEDGLDEQSNDSDEDSDEESSEYSIGAWIKNKIKMRRCNCFIPSNDDPKICQCGYHRRKHKTDALKKQSSELEWKFSIHTSTQPTDAFGEIKFVNYGGNIGKFVRVDIETDMDTVLELMTTVWGLPKPNLLISVIGEDFKMNPSLRDAFGHGLMKAVNSTGAWIITGGTNAEVTQHVGMAVKDYGLTSADQKSVVVISIAPWGVTRHRHWLTDTTFWPAKHFINQLQKGDEIFLDPNHSHFILVDNGTQGKFAFEIPFRAKLEQKISEMQTDTGDVAVPAVILVLGGGPDTLKEVLNALKSNTPIVIVKGSGGLADILSYALTYKETVEVDPEDDQGGDSKITEKNINLSLKENICNQMKDIKFCSEEEIDDNFGRIKDCRDRSHLIHIFGWNSGRGALDMGVAILKAALSAFKGSEEDQLKLALTWNRSDIAKSEIFSDYSRWRLGFWEEGEFTGIMELALMMNRVDFVELLLDNGFSLKAFLTRKTLLMLYKKVLSRHLLKSLLHTMLGKQNEENVTLRDVQQLIQYLLGDYYNAGKNLDRDQKVTLAIASINIDVDAHPRWKSVHIYVNTNDTCITFKPTTEPLKAAKTTYNLTVEENPAEQTIEMLPFTTEEENPAEQTIEMLPSTAEEENPAEQTNDNPEQELFIWSVLNNQQEMAELLWRLGEDPIAEALVASALFSAMSHNADDTELIVQCKGNANKFTNLAIGVLNECYKTDKRNAQGLLIQKLSDWGETSSVIIAAKTNNKLFISHPAVQDLLSNIWMGGMTQGYGTLKFYFKLLTCIAIPPLIPLLATFNEEEDGTLTCGDFATHNSEQKKQRAKPPRSHSKKSNPKKDASNKRQKTRNDQGDETKVDGKCRIIMQKISSFYQAPVVIFFHHVVFYMVFLVLYSYILISKIEETLSVEEIVLIVWVFTISIQEFGQVCSTQHKTLKVKLKSYIKDDWNKVDVIMILLFVLGMILRAFDKPATFEAARIILGISLVLFFLRLLQIFSVHKELGPKRLIIFKMVGDLAYFVVLFMVFVVAYAITSHAVLHPNTRISLEILINIFRRPYFNIYGELMLNEIEDPEDCTNVAELYKNGTYYRCPTVSAKYFVRVLMGLYMVCTIMMMNLLIAMFSCTFSTVQANSHVIWCFQQYSLINEYNNRPFLPPPFILIAYVFQFIKYIVTKCKYCSRSQSAPGRKAFVKEFTKKYRRELNEFEAVTAKTLHNKKKLPDEESINYRLDQLVNKIDELQKQQQTVKETIEDVQSSSSQMGFQSEQKTNIGSDPGSTNLDKRMKNIERQLQWIIQSLNEHQLGARQTISEVTDVEI